MPPKSRAQLVYEDALLHKLLPDKQPYFEENRTMSDELRENLRDLREQLEETQAQARADAEDVALFRELTPRQFEILVAAKTRVIELDAWGGEDVYPLYTQANALLETLPGSGYTDFQLTPRGKRLMGVD